ncbi:taste receptor type 2 member 40-like [Sylvia atricapilla]|uniref:taste receptor type 2 member 40-like n=1 Tax=Sylvia atricapilla TaxID=48155 RepID=UPI003393B48F
MLPSFALLCLSIAIIESMAGILGTGIIWVTCSLSCIRRKMWSPYDMIMISLSSSRFILHFWTALDFLMNIFYGAYFDTESLLTAAKIIFAFLNYSSLWFGAWLSVFYCIKVATFTQAFFIWLKQRIARLVPWMLLTSWLCSVTATIPFAWRVYEMHNFTAPSPTTNSSAMGATRKDSLSVLILSNVGISMPLILSVVSSILLIRSLWIHTRRMQNNASGFRDPSLEAHISAIKSVCSFLILYIIYFICVFIILFKVFTPLGKGDSICVVLMAACPTGHTIILIWSNPKFRELPARIWHHTSCHVRTVFM